MNEHSAVNLQIVNILSFRMHSLHSNGSPLSILNYMKAYPIKSVQTYSICPDPNALHISNLDDWPF